MKDTCSQGQLARERRWSRRVKKEDKIVKVNEIVKDSEKGRSARKVELSSFMSIVVKFVKVTVQDTRSKDNNTVNIIKKSK